jgi:hypothetical protein
MMIVLKLMGNFPLNNTLNELVSRESVSSLMEESLPRAKKAGQSFQVGKWSLEAGKPHRS